MADDRVVIIWKFQAHDSTAFLRLWGRGYIVIQRGPAESPVATVLRSTAWVSPESASPNMNGIQDDARFLVLMEYLKHAFESYAAWTDELESQPCVAESEPLAFQL